MPGPAAPEPDRVPTDGSTSGSEDGSEPRPSAPASVPVRRPLPVLTAAALGFVVGFYLLLNALVLLVAIRVFGAVSAVFGVVYLAVAILGVLGGVLAVTGRRGDVLRAAGLATAALGGLGVVIAVLQGQFSLWSLLLIAVGVGIFVLLGQPVSRQYLAARSAG